MCIGTRDTDNELAVRGSSVAAEQRRHVILCPTTGSHGWWLAPCTSCITAAIDAAILAVIITVVDFNDACTRSWRSRCLTLCSSTIVVVGGLCTSCFPLLLLQQCQRELEVSLLLFVTPPRTLFRQLVQLRP